MLAAAGGAGGGVWDSLSAGADQVMRFAYEEQEQAPVLRGEGTGGGRGADSSPPSSGAQALAAHPELPMFVSGGADGGLQLWSFGAPRPLSSLAPTATSGVTRLAFDRDGQLLAVAHACGACAVYDFARACSGACRRPLLALDAHDKKALDVAFLPPGSTVLVTAGVGASSGLPSLTSAKSRGGASVRVWDLLRPPPSACLASLSIHEGGCCALLALPAGDRLVTGGVKGDLAVICCTTWQPLVALAAHKAALKALACAPSGGGLQRFVTGGADGDVKVWDLHGVLGSTEAGYSGAPACVQHVADCHDTSSYRETLGRSYGVTDLVSTSAFLLSCGGDGRLLRHPWV